MRNQPLAPSPGLDLRGFRQRETPHTSLSKVACAAKVDKAHLSRVETGQRPISLSCARKLARFYSAITGRAVTVDGIVELADRSYARRHPGEAARSDPEQR